MDSVETSETCMLCGRALSVGQRRCACGAVVGGGETSDERDLGAWVPWPGLMGAVIAVWWIFSPGLLYYSKVPMLKLYVSVALLSAVGVMLASRNRPPSRSGGLSPASWFACVLVAWPVAVPYFLYLDKDRHGARMKFGWLTTGLFLGALLVLWMIVRQAPVTWPGHGVPSEPSAKGVTGRSHSVPVPPGPGAPAAAQPAGPNASPQRTNGPIPPDPPNQPVGASSAQPSPRAAAASTNSSGNRAPTGSKSFGAALPPLP